MAIIENYKDKLLQATDPRVPNVVELDLAGSGVNIVNGEYSIIDEANMPPTVVYFGTVDIDPTIQYFGQQTIKLAATAADTQFYMGKTVTDYNVIISPNKKWIISAYVSSSIVNAIGQLYVKTSASGVHTEITFTTSATPNEFTRVYGEIDLSADDSTLAIIRADNEGGSGVNMWFQAFMMEELLGSVIMPSAYSRPVLSNIAPSAPTWGGSPVSQETKVDKDGKSFIHTTIAWIPPSEAVTHYTISWRITGTTDWFESTVVESTLVVDLGLLGETYDVRVAAVNGIAYSDWSTTLSGVDTAVDTTAPDAPTGLTASGGQSIVNVDWVNPTNLDFAGVELYFSPVDGNIDTLILAGTAILAASGNISSKTWGKLDDNISGYFWIRAKDHVGNLSTWEPIGGGEFGSTEGIPDTPTGLTASKSYDAANNGDIIVTTRVYWTSPVASVIGYTLAWRVVGDADWSYYDLTEASITVPSSFIDTYLECKVAARGVGGSSNYTTELLFDTFLDGAIPSAPLNLAVPGSILGEFEDDRFVIGWEYNPQNDTDNIFLKDYVVTVLTADGLTTVKEYILPYEEDSAASNYKGGAAVYHKANIINDFGNPERSFKVSIRTRDLGNRLSLAAELDVSNAAPSVPTGTVTTYQNDVVTTLSALPADVPDITNLITAVSSTAGFDQEDRQFWLAKVPAQRALLGVKYPNVPTGTLYARFALDDTYSDLDLNWTVEVTVDVTGEIVYPTPSTPTGLSATTITTANVAGENKYDVQVTWDSQTDPTPTGYILEWAFNVSGVVIGTVTTTNPSYTFTNVEADGTVYKARVKAVNGTIESAYTAYITHAINYDTTPPASCTTLVGTPLMGSINLTWADPADTDFDKTNVYTSLTNDFSTATLLTSTRLATASMLTSEDATTHHFWVVAVDYDGNEATEHPSALNGVAVIADSDYGYSTPGVPTAVTAVEEVESFADGNVSIKALISWTAPAGAVTSYTIYGGEAGETQSTAETTSTAILSVPLEANKTYNYQVRANHYTSSSSYSTLQTITTAGDVTAPADPTDLTIEAFTNRLIATWTPPSDVDYKWTKIYTSTTNDVATSTLFTTSIDSRKTVDGLATGTAIYSWISFIDYSENESGKYPTGTTGIAGTPT